MIYPPSTPIFTASDNRIVGTKATPASRRCFHGSLAGQWNKPVRGTLCARE